MKIKIQNSHLLDPATGLDVYGDVYIEDGRILAITPEAAPPTHFNPDQVIDATGWVTAPSLVDLRARVGGTNLTQSHWVPTECAAAIAGGIGCLVTPPDSHPILDAAEIVQMHGARAQSISNLQVLPLGALTVGLKGLTLTPMQALMQAGCIGLAQPNQILDDIGILIRAMQYAATFDIPVWLTPLLPALSQGEAASGALAHQMGLRGVPAAAEVLAMEQIFELMRMTGARVHLSCVSTARGVQKLKEAKASGLSITADASMYNALLTQEFLGHFNSDARLWPPLRHAQDAQAICTALQDGTIDAMVSDHSLIADDDKSVPFASAKPGASGLELLLPMALSWAAQQGLGIMQALSIVSSRPARVLNQLQSKSQQNFDKSKQCLASYLNAFGVGQIANLMIFDPLEQWQVQPQSLASSSKHSPMLGQTVKGLVKHTIYSGRCVYSRPDSN